MRISNSHPIVIPGRASWREPGIHTHDGGYGFRARRFASPRNDERVEDILPRSRGTTCPSFANSHPQKIEGAGNAGCWPRGAGLVSPRHRRFRHRQLDLSVGRSGPYDLAVRAWLARLATPTRPPHPALNTPDDAQRPSYRARDARRKTCISEKRKRYILREGLDRANQVEMAGENWGFGASSLRDQTLHQRRLT